MVWWSLPSLANTAAMVGETNSPRTILGVDRCDEVAGNDPGALVDQLVEGVLSVSPGLAPHDRSSGVVDLQI